MLEPHLTSDSNTRGETERGLSDVLAFVIVFGIIIGSVVLLSTVGFQSMSSYQEGEQLRNAERAMDAFGEVTNDVAWSAGIQERSSTVSMGGGTLTTDSTTTSVHIEAGTDIDESIDLGSVSYELAEDSISYEGGTIFRRGSDGGSVALGEPMVSCGDRTGIVTLVNIEGENQSIQASDTVGVRITETDRERFTTDSQLTVSIDDSSPHIDGWESILGGDTWTCSADYIEVHIVTILIEY